MSDAPVLSFFFPFAEAAGEALVVVELLGDWNCLAIIETALKNSGELVNIPGTDEYGNKRTGALGTWTSRL